MSDLVAVAYPDKETAEKVRSRLMQLMTEHAIELEDAVVVDRDQDGRVKLHQLHRPAAAGTAGGALWGGVIGLLFLAPLWAPRSARPRAVWRARLPISGSTTGS